MTEMYLTHFDYLLKDERITKTEFITLEVFENYNKNHSLAESLICDKYQEARIINIIYW